MLRRSLLALIAVITGVVAFAGVATANHPTGADIEIRIDIKPGSHPNSVNPGANGMIPVGLFGSSTFDVSLIDLDTVCLVFHNSECDPDGSFASDPTLSAEAINGDAFLDTVLHFPIQDLTFKPNVPKFGEAGYCVRGMLSTGETFEGCSGIRHTQAT